MSGKDRILVPVDGSEASMRAMALAGEIAKGMGVALEVVTVLDLSQVDVYDSFYLTEAQLEELQAKVKEEVLEKAQAVCPDGVECDAQLLRGRAEKVLDDEAEKPGVKMIVIGRTGKGAFERIVQGSVSRHMTAHSPVPITIVP